jgi:hypothetical protein
MCANKLDDSGTSRMHDFQALILISAITYVMLQL